MPLQPANSLQRRHRVGRLGRVVLALALVAFAGCGPSQSAPAPARAPEAAPVAWDELCRRVASAESTAIRAERIAVRDADLARLPELAGLTELDLASADARGVTPAGLENIARAPSLEVLVLGEMPLADKDLEKLAPLARLRRLNVTGTRLSDAGLARLGEVFPNLRELRIGAPQATAEGLSHLSRLPLDWLILVEMKITDEGARHLARMKSLHSLYLPGCEISDAARAELERAVPHVHD